MTLYETTFILDPELKDDGLESAITKYSGIINQAGSIKHTYRWGLRRMAYEILKKTHGYYVHIIHESQGSVPQELERQFKLDESCMRYLTVVADNPKYLEEMEKGSTQQSVAEDLDSAGGAARAGDSDSDDSVPGAPYAENRHDTASAREDL